MTFSPQLTWAFSPETFREKALRLAAAFKQRERDLVRDDSSSSLIVPASFCERGAQVALQLGEHYARNAATSSTNVFLWHRLPQVLPIVELLPHETLFFSQVWGTLTGYFDWNFSDLDPINFVDASIEAYRAVFSCFATAGIPKGIYAPHDVAALINDRSKQQSEAVRIFIKVQCEHTTNGFRWRHPDLKLGAKLPRAWIS